MTDTNVVPSNAPSPLFSGPVYDKLKFVALILLPALGTLYFALAGLWDWSNATAVVGTIMAVDTFLGIALGISNNQFKKNPDGYLNSTSVNENTSLADLQLTLAKLPHELLAKDTVTLKVGAPPPPVV